MNSVKETNGNGSRTWYQDKKIRIRNTRILDTGTGPSTSSTSRVVGAD